MIARPVCKGDAYKIGSLEGKPTAINSVVGSTIGDQTEIMNRPPPNAWCTRFRVVQTNLLPSKYLQRRKWLKPTLSEHRSLH